MNARSSSWWSVCLVVLSACGGGAGAGPVVAPSGLGYAEDFAVYLVDRAHAPNTASVTGEVAHWSISPALPAGLVLDPGTGTIGGTPGASAARACYTIRASSAAGWTEAQIELTVHRPERYAYVTNPEEASITILALDAESGLVARRGVVIADASVGAPDQFTPHPDGRFGYSTSAQGWLTCWSIDSASGWLERATTVPVTTGAHCLALSRDGRFLYCGDRDGNYVRRFGIDTDTGALAQLDPGTAVPAQPVAMAVDPLGELLLVANRGDAQSSVGSMLTLFRIDPTDGALTAVGSQLLLNGAEPSDCVFALRQDVAYVPLRDAGRVLIVGVDRETGELSALGSAFSGAGCSSLVLDPQARRAWSANAGAGTLSTFDIDESGLLAYAGSSTAGSEPRALAIDPVGRFLFALDAIGQELSLCDLDGAGGAPVRRAGWLVRGRPQHLSILQGEHALVTRPRELVVAGSGSGELHVHGIAPATGALGAAVVLPAGQGASSLAADPRQRFLFCANTTAGTIGRYRIDAQDGSLAELQPAQEIDGSPTHVVVDPTGRFLYAVARDVLAANDGWISTWSLDPVDGELALQGVSPVGYSPSWVGIDPTGTFLYVVNHGDGTQGSASISILRISAANGWPVFSSEAQVAPGAWSMGFHPSGATAYAVLRNANVTVPFRIDSASGALQLAGGGVRASFEPMSIRLTPDGRHAYVAYRNTGSVGHIGMYRVDADTHELLGPAELYADALEPEDLALDPRGTFLYAANHGSDSVSPFGIDPVSGQLELLTPVPSGLQPAGLWLVESWQ